MANKAAINRYRDKAIALEKRHIKWWNSNKFSNIVSKYREMWFIVLNAEIIATRWHKHPGSFCFSLSFCVSVFVAVCECRKRQFRKLPFINSIAIVAREWGGLQTFIFIFCNGKFSGKIKFEILPLLVVKLFGLFFSSHQFVWSVADQGHTATSIVANFCVSFADAILRATYLCRLWISPSLWSRDNCLLCALFNVARATCYSFSASKCLKIICNCHVACRRWRRCLFRCAQSGYVACKSKWPITVVRSNKREKKFSPKITQAFPFLQLNRANDWYVCIVKSTKEFFHEIKQSKNIDCVHAFQLLRQTCYCSKCRCYFLLAFLARNC